MVKLPDPLQAKVVYVEEHFRTALHEYAHIFTLAGVEESRVKGSKDEVKISDEIPSWNRLLTHNHPNGNPELSIKDCVAFLNTGLWGIRSYTLKNGGWMLSRKAGQTWSRASFEVKSFQKLYWGAKAKAKHGLQGPALVAKIFDLDLTFIQPYKEP